MAQAGSSASRQTDTDMALHCCLLNVLFYYVLKRFPHIHRLRFIITLNLFHLSTTLILQFSLVKEEISFCCSNVFLFQAVLCIVMSVPLWVTDQRINTDVSPLRNKQKQLVRKRQCFGVSGAEVLTCNLTRRAFSLHDRKYVVTHCGQGILGRSGCGKWQIGKWQIGTSYQRDECGALDSGSRLQFP